MIVPILWIVANAVGNYAEQLLGFDDSWYFNLLSHLASMIVIWVMFTFLYIVIPNARVRFGSALMAGIVAGTIFLLFQWGYVYVQRWMTSYNAIYGSFAALPLLLIWMQTSWEILLFGGELSFAYQNIARFGEERESLLISSFTAMIHAPHRQCPASCAKGLVRCFGRKIFRTNMGKNLLKIMFLIP